MKWNSELYDNQHGFVSQYGNSLIELLPEVKNKLIWDLGCGTGILSASLRDRGAAVIGTDLSEEMIELARANYPDIDFRTLDAVSAAFDSLFDSVFSNAVFHWILQPKTLLLNINCSLKQNGYLVCEMGAKGNIAIIEEAFTQALNAQNIQHANQFFFPSAEEYASLLEECGFRIELMEEFDRPTPFSGGEEGMDHWLMQFYERQISNLADEMQKEVIKETKSLLRSRLWDGNAWIGDYRRLRFIAQKL